MSFSPIAQKPYLLPGLSLLLGLGLHWAVEIRLSAQPPSSPASVSPTGARQTPASERGPAAQQYHRYCARCHGDDYTGRDSGRRLPDFTSGRWQKSRTDAQLLVSILEGKGVRMPAFSGKLSEGQARELVRLIRNADPSPATPTEASTTDFDRRFAALCKELDELRKEFRALDRDASKVQSQKQRSDLIPPSASP